MRKPILLTLAMIIVAGLVVGCSDSSNPFAKSNPSEDVGSDGVSSAGLVEAVELSIDIKPGSDINPINLKSRGVIPVAILGSADFDVEDIDVSTLAFGPGAASIAHPKAHYGNVNEDEYGDLVTHYWVQESGLQASDTEACVTGELLDGTPLSACDQIQIVPRDEVDADEE